MTAKTMLEHKGNGENLEAEPRHLTPMSHPCHTYGSAGQGTQITH